MRFDLEGAGPAIADIDDARVLARPLHDATAAGGQLLQMHARTLVGAVLAPHHAEDAELGDGRLASAEKLFDLVVFFRREAVLANNFWSDGKSGGCGHEEILLSHLERAEERCFLVYIKRGHVAPVSAVESGWQSLPMCYDEVEIPSRKGGRHAYA